MNSKFTKIGQWQYSSEALIYKGKLESEGIEVFIRDNHTVDSDPLVSNAIGGVKLFVNTHDFEKAKSVLMDITSYSLDDTGELIKCPNCGAEKIELFTTIKDAKSFLSFFLSIFIVALPFYNKYQYKCERCKFEY